MNVVRHFNLNNLPKSAAGLERTTKEVEVPSIILGSRNTRFALRSAVCVKTTPYTNVVELGMATEGFNDVSLVTGSTAVVFKGLDLSRPAAEGGAQGPELARTIGYMIQ